jgi:hypothetical protein
MSQSLLSASDIFGAPDLKDVTELVPEWPKDGSPGSIRFLELDAAQHIEMQSLMAARPKDGMFIIIAMCGVDAEGNRLFPMSTPEEVEAAVVNLRKKNLMVMNRLQRVCLKLNGMGADAKAATKKD